jgi:2-dehydro-3-deoxygluconokinase
MLFIGEPLKEYIATTEPDGTLSNQSFTGFAGDVAPNMASYTQVVAAQFGIPCTIDVLTAVGPEGDGQSDDIVADFKARSLNIHPYTKRLAGKELGIVINLKNTDGSQSQEKVRLDRSNSAFRDLLNDATHQDLATMADGYTHVVVSSTSLACVLDRAKLITLLREARTNDPPPRIVVSTNLRSPNWQMPDREHPGGLSPHDHAWRQKAQHWLDAVIQLADVVFANFTDERSLRGCETPEEVGQVLRRLNEKAEILITNDADPVLAIYDDGERQRCVRVSVHPAEQVIDTVGAGDAFAGTYVAARMAGRDWLAAVECALAIASQVVGFDGAVPRNGRSLVFDPRVLGAPTVPYPL